MEDILKEAVSMGQANEVDSLLKKGVNADIIDENGYSLLHIACTVNETKILRLLIAHGLELEAEDHHYNTPLHVACERGAWACAEILIESGARVDVKNDKKKTPFSLVKNKPALAKLKSITPKPRTSPPTLDALRALQISPGAASSSISPRAMRADGSTMELDPEMTALAQQLTEKMKTLNMREDELVQREASLRVREADVKRRQADLDAKLSELTERRSKYEKSEKQLRAMVDAHNRNEFVAAMCVVSWESIILKSKLGSGSFAAVYKGIWRGTQVAVKRPFLSVDNPPHGLSDSDATDLFCREVKLLSRLRHPNIVLLMAACMEPQNLSMVLELCRADLFSVIHDTSIQITPKKLIGFAIDATQALLYMHTHSPALCHRDIKTSNMLISPSGELKLVDFGYASFVGEIDFVYTRHKLAEKANKGTPAYMAPECLKNEEVTPKSDIYSLGTVLWELMTRKVPWHGKSPEGIYAEVTTGNRLAIPDDPAFTPAYSELINSCWLEVPSDRPSARTILKVLRGIRKVL